jgi:hypothetical protein
MMPADPTTLIAALGVEPTYSSREAATLLGRSYSWLDQRLRAGQFTNPDGSVLQLDTGGFRSCHQAELFGRIVRVHGRGPRLAPSHTLKAVRTCHRILGQPVHSDGSVSATAH